MENYTVKSVLLSNVIILTAHGMPFFQAGDEMLRSKAGDHNSYSSGDAVNMIQWEKASCYMQVVNYYDILLKLRKQQPTFHINCKIVIEQNIEILLAQDNVVSFL